LTIYFKTIFLYNYLLLLYFSFIWYTITIL